MFGLTQIQTIVIGSALAVVLVGGAITYIYNKGESAGSAAVTTAVQQKTIETLDAARKAKDQADTETRAKPYGERVDGLR